MSGRGCLHFPGSDDNGDNYGDDDDDAGRGTKIYWRLRICYERFQLILLTDLKGKFYYEPHSTVGNGMRRLRNLHRDARLLGAGARPDPTSVRGSLEPCPAGLGRVAPGLRLPEAFRVPCEITPTLTSLTSGVLAGRLRGVVPASPHVARAREMM